MEPPRQRSRKGCLPCRQKRKKCDEIKPVCSRCKLGGSFCDWPPRRYGLEERGAAGSSDLAPIRSRSLLTYHLQPSELSSDDTSSSHSLDGCKPTRETHIDGSNLCYPAISFTSYNAMDILSPFELGLSLDLGMGQPHAPVEPKLCAQPPPSFVNKPRQQTLGLPVVPLGSIFDEDEEEAFKTTQWLPAIRDSICVGISHTDPATWSNTIDLHLTFITRFTYDPTKIPANASIIRTHVQSSECVRLGMIGVANLYYSILNPSVSPITSQKRARELIEAANTALQVELVRSDVPITSILAGIHEIICYHLYSGNFEGYQKCIQQAVILVKKLVGTTPLRLHMLHGPHTIEIRLLAWCDIFSALATSRPTRLLYDYNAENLLLMNQAGPNYAGIELDAGVEWFAGLPDALLLLTIQIINLRHTQRSSIERITQAAKIETALRNWKVWPSSIVNSKMKVQRMSAQEIWRHFVILFLYQAIYKASPANPIVQQSVKQIVQLAATLEPGHNPDCLLCVPYFIAGTVAVSAQHRHFLKTRILHSSNDAYTTRLANGLDEIWRHSKDSHRHHDWATLSPSIAIMF